MSNYWGFHLAVDALGPKLDSIASAETITAWVKDLVKRIDMVAYGEPNVVRFGTGKIGRAHV